MQLQLQLQLLEISQIDAVSMLHSPGFAPPDLACALITTEPLVVASPEHHALAAAAKPALPNVLAEPLEIFPHRVVPPLHEAIFGADHADV